MMLKKLKKIIYRDYFSPKIKIRRRLDLNLLLGYRNYIDRHLIIGEPYETEQIARCLQLIEEQRLEWFLDIGSNIGIYSLLVAKHRPQMDRICAFEPDPANYHQLCGNIFLNGFWDNIEVRRLGLSNQAGDASFLKNLGSSTGTSRIAATAPASTRTHRYATVTIPVETLDRVFPRLTGKRLMLKVDVEGHEVQVLEGARSVLANNICYLQMEILDENADRLDFILEQFQLKRLRSIGADVYLTNDPSL
jgi:FkbM family methyltransferase